MNGPEAEEREREMNNVMTQLMSSTAIKGPPPVSDLASLLGGNQKHDWS